MEYFEDKIPFWEHHYDEGGHWYVQYHTHHFILITDNGDPSESEIRQWCEDNCENIRHWHYTGALHIHEFDNPSDQERLNRFVGLYLRVVSFTFESDAIRFKMSI